MTLAVRTTLILTLLFTLATEVVAQQTDTAAPATTAATAPPAATTDTTATVVPDQDAAPEDEARAFSDAAIRERYIALLERHPREVARILSYDPTLINNLEFMRRYPDIAAFVHQNPQIRRNPHYFQRHYSLEEPRRSTPLDHALEMLAIFGTVTIIAVALAWFLRTLIEQRRWNKLSKAQAEVHNKILDRLGTSNELLEYVKSTAGSKFLESAPIPVRAAERPVATGGTPLHRIVWTVQIGVVIVILAIGLMVMGAMFEREGEGVWALGVIAFALGAGFIGSAIVSLVMSKRLGLWRDVQSADREAGDGGLVR